MIIHFIIIFNHQIPYMVSSTSIQCLHTTSNKIFVSYHFYKLRWLPTASNRIQTPSPKNSILQDFPASISSMSPPHPRPKYGVPTARNLFISSCELSHLLFSLPGEHGNYFFAWHILYHHSCIGRNVTTAFHTIQRWSLTTHLDHLYFIIGFPS